MPEATATGHSAVAPVAYALVSATFAGALLTAAQPARPAQLGTAPPACAFVDRDNPVLNGPDSFHGQVVLIDFWASWCPPCRKSLPFLDSLRHEFRQQGFEVIGVNVDEDKKDAIHFLEHNPVGFPVLFDPDGSCPAAYEIPTMPASYLVDRGGHLRAIHRGYQDRDAEHLRRQVARLLAE